ncbi:MAG: hypothetical protein ACRC7S_16395 [Cetobacterium sp.]
MIAYNEDSRVIYIEDSRRCPECGGVIWSYGDMDYDPSDSEYCGTDGCPYTSNQYMTWDDIKEVCIHE